MSEELGFNVYKVNMGGKAHRYVSPLPMALVAKHGLVAEAIVGEVTGDAEGVTSENFKANPAFIKFLQWSISRNVQECKEIQEEAKKVGDGNIIVPDFRQPAEDGSILQEDVIGLVEVKNGEIVLFHASPDYIPFTEKGFMILDSFFKDRHEADLLAHIAKQVR